MQRTLYEVLGVSTKATAVEVKAAYRRKVLVHHPDVQQQGGTCEEFLACRHAYEVLTDGQQRLQYDQRLQDAAQGQGHPAADPSQAGTGRRHATASPGPACMGAASAATTAPPPHSVLRATSAATAAAAAAAGLSPQLWQTYIEQCAVGAAQPGSGDCPSMADLRALLLQECGAVVEDFESVQEALGTLPWDDRLHNWYSAATPGPECTEAQRQQQQQQQAPWAGTDHSQLWNWLQEQHHQQQQQQQSPW